MKVVFTEEARRDLRRIADYIGRESPGRALEFVRRLRHQAQDLAVRPLAFPLLWRFEKAGIRRRVYRSYLILYKVEADHVIIVRVLHGARNYAALLFSEA